MIEDRVVGGKVGFVLMKPNFGWKWGGLGKYRFGVVVWKEEGWNGFGAIEVG